MAIDKTAISNITTSLTCVSVREVRTLLIFTNLNIQFNIVVNRSIAILGIIKKNPPLNTENDRFLICPELGRVAVFSSFVSSAISPFPGHLSNGFC